MNIQILRNINFKTVKNIKLTETTRSEKRIERSGINTGKETGFNSVFLCFRTEEYKCQADFSPKWGKVCSEYNSVFMIFEKALSSFIGLVWWTVSRNGENCDFDQPHSWSMTDFSEVSPETGKTSAVFSQEAVQREEEKQQTVFNFSREFPSGYSPIW